MTTQTRALKRSASKRDNRSTTSKLPLGALFVYLGLPLVVLVIFSFAQRWGATLLPADYTFGHWISVLTSPDVAAATGRSLLVTALVVSINLIIVIPAAYVAVVAEPRVRSIIHAMAIVPFALPWIVIAAGVQLTVGEFAPQLFPTVGLLVVTLTSTTFPYLYWAVENAMISNRVRHLTEAARMSGAGLWQTLTRVVIPASRTGIMSGSLLVASATFGEFAITLTLVGGSYETLPLWTLRMFNGRVPGAGAELAAVSFGIFAVLFLISMMLTKFDKQPAPSLAASTAKKKS